MQHFLWKIEQFIEMSIGITLVAMGLSFMMKSGLGQTALTAFTQCISIITNIKSGTIIMWFYLLCVLFQILLQKKEFEKIQLLQILISWIQGIIINLFCYDISFFAMITPTSYIQQWMFIMIGIILVSFGVAFTMAAEFIKQPFEQLIMVLSKKYDIAFGLLRSSCDALFIILCFVMIFVFTLDFTVLREGTWISMLTLGNFMAFTIPFVQKYSIHYIRAHSVSNVKH